MTTSLKTIVPLALALFALLSYQFIAAQWTDAPANPPQNNVEAPLNVGATEQIKNGKLGVAALSVFGQTYVQGTTTNTDPTYDVGLDVHGSTGAELYCDRYGQNCFAAAEVYARLNPAGPSDCELDGVTVPHGGSYTFHDRATDANCSAHELERTCTDGVLDGDTSYIYANCSTSYTYAWNTTSYGSCSVSCGGGTRTRTVTCRRNDGATVSDSFCSGTKPAESQSCNTSACAPTYSSCTTVDGVTISHGSSRPIYSETCGSDPAVGTCNYDWMTCDDGSLPTNSTYMYGACNNSC